MPARRRLKKPITAAAAPARRTDSTIAGRAFMVSSLKDHIVA